MEKIKNIIPYIIIIVLVVLFRTFIATPVRVNGPSMDTTLKDGEILILNKMSDIKRYNIVVVEIPGDRVIKRLIGLPGDEIECINGKMKLNGKVLKEKYISSETYDFEKVILKDDEYFVMGDNRSVSLDSRSFGPVKRKQILGTTNFRLFPFNKFGEIE